MAAPNIVNVATITGKTIGYSLTNVASDIVTNSTSSGKVFKINSVYVANIDGTNNTDVTVNFVDWSDSNTSYSIANTITVPADATLVIVEKTSAIYLEEGDKLRAFASANGDLQMTVSYEEIS